MIDNSCACLRLASYFQKCVKVQRPFWGQEKVQSWLKSSSMSLHFTMDRIRTPQRSNNRWTWFARPRPGQNRAEISRNLGLTFLVDPWARFRIKLILKIPSLTVTATDMRELPSLQPPTLPSKRFILERLGHLELDPKSILPGVGGKKSSATRGN